MDEDEERLRVNPINRKIIGQRASGICRELDQSKISTQSESRKFRNVAELRKYFVISQYMQNAFSLTIILNWIKQLSIEQLKISKNKLGMYAKTESRKIGELPGKS